jgi:hypothetical protein
VSRSPDRATRATRDAANVSVAAVVAFAALWLLATQVKWIRAWSPFADDPWDAVMTYAAMFLPFVAGPTWIRSLAHRDPILPPLTARRIRWGAGLAALIVAIAAAADVQAILTIGFDPGAGRLRIVLGGLAVGALVLAVLALIVNVRAARLSGGVDEAATEPDVVDDLVALAAEIGGSVGLERPIERAGGRLERFLEVSAWSPRRHRIAFGVVLALIAAAAFDLWHAFREGAWANATVPIVFGTLIASGVLAIYLGTLGPLRLLRPPGR